MKFKADRASLLKALAHVQSVVEKRNTIPILANVMIAVRDNALSLTATDMEIAIVEDVPAVTLGPGACTAPAATLYDIVRKLPDGAEVEIEHPGGEAQLSLRAGRYHTNLVVLPTDDFPQMTAGSLSHRFGLSAQKLRELIDHTRFAISTEETRYYLNGIYIHDAELLEAQTGDADSPEGKARDRGENAHVLRAVATDGHRLARVEETLPDGARGMPGVIVPRKTVNELRKLLDEVSGNIDIGLSETRIQFRLDNVLLTSKLIDGTFPEYDRVIPRGNDKIMRVLNKDFAAAVGRVAAISAERQRPVKLTLSRDLLVLSASSPEAGVASEELDADRVQYDSTPLEIGFQARYLNDITDQIGERVEFRFSDGAAPTVVVDGADERALYVLMPMRV